ncbi:aldose 1-epimerase family protein [Lacipirellula sp.]|uniref:aldose 1-epimerase family protein n=1 Tax=Lacipirellula sp. TaxID=2691419 RepID=UPI003D0FFBCA
MSTHVLHASEFVLIDAAASIDVPEFEKSEKDFPQLRAGPWQVEKRLLHGGKQEGTELIVVSNGKLRFGVSPTRGMSVVFLEQISDDKFPVGWKSPITEVVHPQFVDLESRNGLGWLDGFNEWMCRCGLEFAGHPGKDAFTTNTGEPGEMPLTLHGKIGNTPASRVTFSIDEAPPHRIRIKGTVFERSFHGPKLRLETEISTVPGSESVEINDRVANLGGSEQEFQLIYHTNYGDPILEQGAKIFGAFKALQPMNEHAAKSIAEWNMCQASTPGFVEQVYLATPVGDAEGRTSILLENSTGTKGASISWNIAQLPYVTIWKNLDAKEDGYVTGLEPGTGFPFNRRVERHFGRVPTLQPGETREFALSFHVHPDSQSVEKVRQRIEAIQRRQPMTVTPTAPAIPEFTQDAE